MKSNIGWLLAAGFGLSTLSLAFSQQGNLDPTLLSPEIYETVMENDQVRVIRVTATDGNQAAIHSHPDRVLVYVDDCTWLNSKDDGTIAEWSNRAGDVVWKQATTHGGNVTHVRETCTLLEVELK